MSSPNPPASAAAAAALFSVNVVIPMAGAGSRFAKEGYRKPKPFIDVGGRPMIRWVLDNVQSSLVHIRWCVIIQRAHDEQFQIAQTLKTLVPDVTIAYADGLTEGAACTTLLARDFYDNDTPLFIINSDQFLQWDSDAYWRERIEKQNVEEGNIVCFTVRSTLDNLAHRAFRT
jgi:dTDP-glucose pyrophosphorylase